MPRKKIRDIKPPSDKRSIRNIGMKRNEDADTSNEQAAEPQPPQRPSRMPRRARMGMWALVILILAVAGFAFFLLFSGAHVTVVPKTETVTVDGTFTAAKTDGAGDIAFETVTITSTASITVPAGESESVERHASGVITVYNDYSDTPQRFVENTRFQTSDGKVYRTREAISIPGRREVDGETQPGSIDVRVYAAEAGEEYNVADAEFTIPGLSGSELFNSMWAETKTAISGGFVGTQPVVSEEDQQQARVTLQEQLQEQLRTDARDQIPTAFHLFDQAANITLDPLQITEASESGTARITTKGTFTAAIFNLDTLARLIAEHTLATYAGAPVHLANEDDLSFAPAQPDTFSPSSQERFTFTLSGQADLVWSFDQAQLAADLAGTAEQTLQQTLSNYTGIEEAEIVLRPFWRRSFPPDPDDITITVRQAVSGQ